MQLLSSSMDVLLKNMKQHDQQIHERSIRIVLNDYSSNFNELLENNNTCVNSSALSGCHPHFRQLTHKKMLLNITCTLSKSTAIKLLFREHKSLFLLTQNNNLAITFHYRK